MKLNKRWQDYFLLKTYDQYDNNRMYERFINQNFHTRLIKFKDIFLKGDDRFIIIITNNFYETHVRKSTEIKKRNKITYM